MKRSLIKSIGSLLLFFLVLFSVSLAGADTLDVRISADIDDVEEATGNNLGRVYHNSSDLELVYDGWTQGNQIVGLRFRNITIPQNATINSAYLEFTADENRTNNNTLTIYGEDIGDASQFISGYGSFNVSNRTKTSASEPWVPGTWDPVGSKYQTPDISSIVSEITGRTDWSNGNDMVFIIEGAGRVTADSFQAGGNNRPRLVIDYSTQPPEIQLNKTVINVETIQGTPATSDTFTITNSGGSTLNYTISEDANAPDWLQVAPTTGSLTNGQTDTITVNFAGSDLLALGTYTATITAQDPSAVPTTRTIAVTLQVGKPEITLDHSAIPVPVTMEADTTDSSHSFTVTNSGSATLSFTADDDASWLSMSPTNGILDPGNSTTITLTFNAAGLTANTGYNTIVTVSDPEASNNPKAFQVDLVTYKEQEMSGEGDNMNDAEEFSDGSIDSSEEREDLDMGEHLVGIRFPVVTVDRDETIHKSFILMQAQWGDSVETDLVIHIQNKEDPPINDPLIFTTINGNISDRALWGTDVQWNNIEPWSTGQISQTPDLSVPVQYIVNRPSWNSGQAMVFVIDGNGERDAASYDSDDFPGPILKVWTDPDPAPLIVLSKYVIKQEVDFGTTLPDDTFTVSNKGSGNLEYGITDIDEATGLDATWISVAPPNGGPLPNDGSTDTFTITYDTTLLPNGEHTAIITVTDPDAKPTSARLKVTVTVNRPVIELDPTTMNLELGVGGTASRQFTITNTGALDLNNYTIADIDLGTGIDASWMSVDPASGGPLVNDGTFHTINVNFDATGLTVNTTYTGIITVTDPSGAAFPKIVSVSLYIGQPHIDLTHNLPDPIVLPVDYANNDYSFTIGNSGTVSLNFTISDIDNGTLADAAWMSFTPQSGSVAAGGPEQTVTINLSTSGLMEGETYEGTITVSDPLADNDPQTIPVRISILNQGEFTGSDSSDDAEEDTSDGDMYLTSSDLEMVDDGGDHQIIGIRFNNVNIPAGSLINNAYIRFMADGSTSGDVDLEIYGEKTGDAQTFTYTEENVSNRTRTDAMVAWNDIPNWSNGSMYNTPNIAELIQEIVTNENWQFNNSMSFVIQGDQGTRRAHSYDQFEDNSNYLPPTLVVEWVESEQPYIVVSPSGQLGVITTFGTNAADRTFTLKNTGAGDLVYTIQPNATWLSCSPASGTLAPGGSQEVTVSFLTASLAISNYSTTITISDPQAFNSPYDYVVNLQVNAQDTGSGCGDIPIYAENIINPAILVQLDTSSSMTSSSPTNTSVSNPRTPNLKNIFQSMLNDPAWTPNVSDIAFIITGSGNRTAISYDGGSSDAPELHVNYYPQDDPLTTDIDESDTLVEYSNRITQSSDDAEERTSDGHVSFVSTDIELITDNNSEQVVGLRFQNINVPSDATLDDVYIAFSKNVTSSTPTSLTIKGEDASAGGNNFQAATFDNVTDNISSRPTLINVVSWNNLDTWWGDTTMRRYEVGRAVIADLVKDRSIAWGYGIWDRTKDGPKWSGSGSGPNTDQLSGPTYDTNSTDYLQTPYHSEYSSDPPSSSQYDLFTRITAPVQSRDAEETVDLQNTILTTTTGSGTPLGPSMLAARAYFNGQKEDVDGNPYSSLSCQRKFLINITDGQGYLNHTSTQYMERYAHWLADSEITAVVVGFELSNASQIDVVARASNERGEESATDKIYAVHKDLDDPNNSEPDHEDVDAFSAASGEDLKIALEGITSEIKRQLFFGSAPAPSTSVDMGSFVIVAVFNPADNWRGDLKALPYDPDTGQIDVSDIQLTNPPSDCAASESTCWRAGYLLPETGWLNYSKAFTVAGPLTTPTGDGTGSIISYTDDILPNDNYICKGLGDIIKSTPKIIDKPKSFHSFDRYPIFQSDSDVRDRTPLVSIGANDGALHFFNLETGVESHRFYPMGVHGTLNMAAGDPTYDTCNEQYCHRYMVDGSPIAADIFTGTEVISGGVVTDTGWRTIVITGLGNGGDSYFAIDTTYNNPFDATTNPSVYLWNYTDSDLGLATSNPVIARVNAPARDGNGDMVSNGAFGGWATYFGSGYSQVNQELKESYLYGLKAWDKAQLWSASEKIKIEVDNTIDYSGLTVDFTSGEAITGETSGATGTILALTKSGTEGTLKLTNINGTFVLGEPLNGSLGGDGMAIVSGTIHSSYLNDALNTPVVSDIDFNNIGEYIYLGTLHGRMHRVMNIGENETPSVACVFDFGENRLTFNSLTTSFTAGQTVTGQTSGASGKIVHIEINGTSGTLYLVDIAGAEFQDGETIQGGGGGTATVVGTLYQADIPIRAEADWAYGEGDDLAWLYFGTGRFETQFDKTTTDQNFFVGMKDYIDTAESDPVDETYLNDLVGNSIVTLTDSALTPDIDESQFRNVTGSNPDKDPWYIKLLIDGYSERIITKPLIAGGLVFFQTFIPDNDPCGGNGSAWLYVVDYETGLPPTNTVFDIDRDGDFDADDLVDVDGGSEADDVVVGVYLGRGTPTGLVLEGNILFAGTSDGGVGGGGGGEGGFGGGGGFPINPEYLVAKLKAWRDSNL